MIENFIKCPNCDMLIINVKPEDIERIPVNAIYGKYYLWYLTCPYCKYNHINLNGYDPTCGCVEQKYRFNI